MTYQEFRKKHQIQLNPQQEAAVQQAEGPVLLLARPRYWWPGWAF